jgi:hypothetical protein
MSGMKDFDDYAPPLQPQIARLIDDAEPAATQLSFNRVAVIQNHWQNYRLPASLRLIRSEYPGEFLHRGFFEEAFGPVVRRQQPFDIAAQGFVAGALLIQVSAPPGGIEFQGDVGEQLNALVTFRRHCCESPSKILGTHRFQRAGLPHSSIDRSRARWKRCVPGGDLYSFRASSATSTTPSISAFSQRLAWLQSRYGLRAT